ncbi:hypothetical protein B296_00024251, partial [Ensete ventricosum]
APLPLRRASPPSSTAARAVAVVSVSVRRRKQTGACSFSVDGGEDDEEDESVVGDDGDESKGDEPSPFDVRSLPSPPRPPPPPPFHRLQWGYLYLRDGGRPYRDVYWRSTFSRPAGMALRGPLLPLSVPKVSFSICRLSVRFIESMALLKTPPTIAKVAVDVVVGLTWLG